MTKNTPQTTAASTPAPILGRVYHAAEGARVLGVIITTSAAGVAAAGVNVGVGAVTSAGLVGGLVAGGGACLAAVAAKVTGKHHKTIPESTARVMWQLGAGLVASFALVAGYGAHKNVDAQSPAHASTKAAVAKRSPTIRVTL